MRSFAANNSNAGRRAMTMTEVLVATAVSLILISSVAGVYIQIIRAHNEAQAQVRAHSTARAATDKIGNELRELLLDNTLAFQELLLTDRPLAFGDGIDNDNDGSVDEEILDGFDDDGDWTGTSDQHAAAGPIVEREDYLGVADLGDFDVDEDVRFSADEISFVIPGTPRRLVTYRLDSFDGQDNVLVREETRNPSAPIAGNTGDVEPVAFDVVSLDVLAWNPNSDATGPVGGEPYWASEWQGSTKTPPGLKPLNAPDGTPPFKLPAAFFVQVTVNAEDQPLSELPNWQNPNVPLKTVAVSTVVTVESVTNDNRYFRFLREGPAR